MTQRVLPFQCAEEKDSEATPPIAERSRVGRW